MATRPIVILGAGLSGLSLAVALREAGERRPLVLIDRRRSFDRDRTWCFWQVAGVPWAELATARWGRWSIVGQGREAHGASERHPYLHLPADRFYAAALARLEGEAELRLGTRVLGVVEGADRVLVETTAGTLEADVVVDALGGGGPLLRGRPSGAVELAQRFVGVEVETEHAVFDPATATLMDFRVGSVDGSLDFIYTLPFSPTRALVEHTSFGGPVVAAAARRAAIARHLEETVGAGAVTVLREERGVLPMTTYAFEAARGPRLVAVGQAAGAGRPSSGYAFVRTQRHATALARALVRGEAPPRHVAPVRQTRLDALFLRALAASPAHGAAWFTALLDGVGGDTFARFMSDASTPADEARILRALLRVDFLAAMARGERGAEPRRARVVHVRPQNGAAVR